MSKYSGFMNKILEDYEIAEQITYEYERLFNIYRSDIITFLLNKKGYFKGFIGDVRIYNRALTSDEVSTLYSTNKKGDNS